MGVTFGILLASGVLLGGLALVVDVGRLYVERGDLQNGADSAALALARACADSQTECDSERSLRALAQRYANDNAADGTSNVDVVCGDVPGVLPSCGPQPANLTGCPGDPPASPYVEVHTSTRMADGGTVLPPAFAQALAGGDAGTTVGACARAAWGDLSVVALTIDQCLYDAWPHLAAGAAIDSTDERPIQFWWWDVNPPKPCGSDRTPNIAGLLDGADSACEITMSSDGVIGGSFFDFIPERVASTGCVDRILRAQQQHEVIYLPVYDSRTVGATPSFHHAYVAPFVVTAFQLGAPPAACVQMCTDPETGMSYWPEDYREGSDVSFSTYRVNPCGTPAVGHRCLTGAFVGPPVPISSLTSTNAAVRLVA